MTSAGCGIEVLPGTVPANLEGSAASAVFSIEHPVDLPAPLPGDTKLAGEVVQFGPEGVAFRWPVRITLPYRGGAAPDEFQVVHYDRMLERWYTVPVSFLDRERHVLGVDVLELGLYAVGEISVQQGDEKPGQALGGIEVNGEPGFCYAVTVEAASPRDFYRTNLFYLAGQIAGCSLSAPAATSHGRLPQGDYSIRVSRMDMSSASGLPVIETSILPVELRISRPVADWGLVDEHGWTVVEPSRHGDWREGIPTAWPVPQAPPGTGDLQVTLTWTNTDQAIADLDLHLYGPGSLHMYWDKTESPDSTLVFETDWMKERGNAVENIYNIGPVGKGMYRVEVQHYSGSRMSFRVRVVRFNWVKTYFGVLNEKEVRQVAKFEVE